jgi:prepilin-type N-terminal cleavage/methylation domain-containing protein
MVKKIDSGMTLVEVMIASAIGSMVVLGIATSMRYGLMGLKTFTLQQAASSFRDQVQATLDNPAACKMIFSPSATASSTSVVASSLIDPSRPVNTVTAVTLKTPFSAYDTTLKNLVDDRLRISSISFVKIADVVSRGRAGDYVMNGNTYYPVIGQLNIVLNNEAVTQHIAYGAQKINYSFPLSLTFIKSGNTWNIDQCAAQTSDSILNSGWNSVDLPSSPSLSSPSCVTIPVTSGTTATCPPGTYIVSQQQSLQSTTTYSPACDCTGSCKGCACVADSGCGNECNGSSPINRYNNCKGTCDPNYHCYGNTESKNTLTVTCCKVRR